MNTKTRRVLSCAMVILLTFGLIKISAKVLERKYSRVKYKDFFTEKEDFDVLFLGSSHVIDGITPMDIWHDYGIVSYNMGGHSNTVPTSYWVLKNALDYTHPRVVVMDGYLVGSPYKISGDNYSSAHTSFDAFPLTFTKAEGVYDLMNDEAVKKGIEEGTIVENEKRTPMGLLWNFSVYHSRWSGLEKEDFEVTDCTNKGAEDRIGICPIGISQDDSVAEIDSVGTEYLDKIVELCKKNDINLLLTYLPARNGTQSEANWIQQYSENNEIDCINFMNTDCINPMLDYSDNRGHLNPSGAKKVSNYIAQYVTKNYEVPNRKDDLRYKTWNQDFDKYVDYKIELLKSEKDVATYLMLLNDSSFVCKITMTNGFQQSFVDYISNIDCLGSCKSEYVESLEYSEMLDGCPDAVADIYYNGSVIESAVLYNGIVYHDIEN